MCGRHRQYRRGMWEWVLLVSGSSARQAHKSETSPVDLCVIGIVDEAASDGQVILPQVRQKIMNQQDIEQVVKAVLLKMQRQ